MNQHDALRHLRRQDWAEPFWKKSEYRILAAWTLVPPFVAAVVWLITK